MSAYSSAWPWIGHCGGVGGWGGDWLGGAWQGERKMMSCRDNN